MPAGISDSRSHREADRRPVDARRRAARPAFDVDAEDRLRALAEGHVKARLAVGAGGQDEQQPAVERGLAPRGRIRDLEAQRSGRRRGLQGVERDEPGGKGGGGHQGKEQASRHAPECSRQAVTPPGLVASVP